MRTFEEDIKDLPDSWQTFLRQINENTIAPYHKLKKLIVMVYKFNREYNFPDAPNYMDDRLIGQYGMQLSYDYPLTEDVEALKEAAI